MTSLSLPDRSATAVELEDSQSVESSSAEAKRRTNGAAIGRRAGDARSLGLVGLLALLALIGVVAGISWVVIIVLIVVTLFLHELGHFATARLTGMKVTEFFIGFGPRVWSFRRGETEYGIKAVWAGAYVRIVGMNNLDEVAPADESRSFRSKSFPRKLLVLVAGSGMHFAIAVGLLFAALSLDERIGGGGGDPAAEVQGWTLDTVSYASAAAAAGLQPGDQVITVNGVRSGTFIEFSRHVQSLGGTEAEIVYLRDGEERVTRTWIGERLTDDGADGITGLIAGDRILGVEGLQFDGAPTYAAIAEHARDRLGEPLDITIVDVRTGRPALVENAVIERLAGADTAVQGFFGVSADYPREGMGVVDASWTSLSVFKDILGDVVFALPKIATEGFFGAVTGFGGGEAASSGADTARELEIQRLDSTHPDENRVLSIYGVARIGAEVASNGAADVLLLMVFVNVFIGVFNLLPLPPLDGGHVAIAVYERLRSIGRRPYRMDAAKLLPLTYAVVIVLVLIGSIALARDILDPISLG